jgi:hypothetical protein
MWLLSLEFLLSLALARKRISHKLKNEKDFFKTFICFKAPLRCRIVRLK